jgi:hypothetical protein
VDTATPQAAPPPVLAAPAPTCHNTSCQERPLVQWRRRLTAAELAQELALEQQRRADRYELRDVQKPPPVEGPMPTGEDFVRAVLACGSHAIDIDAAALVHAADCPGPDSRTLPGCGCTPEPEPEPEPVTAPELPAHWKTAVTGSA